LRSARTSLVDLAGGAGCVTRPETRAEPLGDDVLRALRSASAWALPRPSAIASAKLANSTVNQSQSETARMKPAAPRRAATRRGRRAGGEALPTSTTNITGLRIMRRGSSLRARRQRAADDGRVEERAGSVRCERGHVGLRQRCGRAAGGARRSGRAPARDEGQRADEHDGADEQADEERRVGRQRAGARPGRSSSSPALPAIASTGTITQ
jgi:hypothetical protein